MSGIPAAEDIVRAESLCKGCGRYLYRHDWSCMICSLESVEQPKQKDDSPAARTKVRKPRTLRQAREQAAYYETLGKTIPTLVQERLDKG